MIETDKLRESSKQMGGGKSVNNIREQRDRITQKINEQIAIASANGDRARVEMLRARRDRVNGIAKNYVNNIQRLGESQGRAQALVKKAIETGKEKDINAAAKAMKKANSVSYGRSTYQNNTNRRYEKKYIGKTYVGGVGSFRDNTNSSRQRTINNGNNYFARINSPLRYTYQGKSASGRTAIGNGNLDKSRYAQLRNTETGRYAKGTSPYYAKPFQFRYNNNTKPRYVNKRRRSK